MLFKIKVISHLSLIPFLTYSIIFLYEPENSFGNRVFMDNNAYKMLFHSLYIWSKNS